ncbi:hypothetical protein L1887_55183 [Cichorium endivia]|nr:hypothetical protein L1887_55183 [Cichorium endivia]
MPKSRRKAPYREVVIGRVAIRVQRWMQEAARGGISQKLEPRAEARAQSPADVQPAYTAAQPRRQVGQPRTKRRHASQRAATACPSAPKTPHRRRTRNHPPRKRPWCRSLPLTSSGIMWDDDIRVFRMHGRTWAE